MTPCIVLAGGGTGGHVFPMLAVAKALEQLAPEARVVFVGTSRGMESRIVPERGFELELIEVLPLRGQGARGVLEGGVRAALATREARSLLQLLGASVVFSAGGYAAGPVSLAARSLGIPVGVMEPNGVIGLANRLMAPFVQRAYTAFAEVERHFAPQRVLRTGVPIREGFEPKPYVRDTALTRLLVLGGSQGAKALNDAVPRAVAEVPPGLRVTHQCGPAHEAEVRALYASLGLEARVQVVPFIEDMPAALAAADLVISRSGASAVSEICAVGRPSLLVPYPYAAGDHQRRNAEAIEGADAAVCILNERATPERLAREIRRLTDDPGLLARMAERARSLGRPRAAFDVASDLLRLAGLPETVESVESAMAQLEESH